MAHYFRDKLQALLKGVMKNCPSLHTIGGNIALLIDFNFQVNFPRFLLTYGKFEA